MNNYAFHVLRAGLAITFIWIGVLIFQDPAGWAAFIKPWAADILFVSPERAIMGTAVFDILVGVFLLVDFLTFWASLLASLHLISVLAVAGIDAITVRDIGLLAGALALAVFLWPSKKGLYLLK